MRRFADGELESLETEGNKNIELKEFIPLSKVDPVFYETVHYLGALAPLDRSGRTLQGDRYDAKHQAPRAYQVAPKAPNALARLP
jgi:hypothetical protein